jgi:2-aminoethylphosphonate dioxygenase
MTRDVKQEYRENGFLHRRGVFTPEEIAAFQAECDRLLHLDLVHPDNIRTPFRMNSGETPERIDPVVDISPVFAALVEDARIVNVVRDLFEDAPRLFKDKLILKLPGTSGYSAHQDQAWWQLCPPDDILSVSVQMDGANAENGGIELFRGYHDRLRTPEGVMRNWTAEEEAEWLDPARSYLPETRPGDVLIFHSLTPHRSGRNTSSGKPRRSLYLSYSAARSGDLHAVYYEQYKGRENNAGKFFK